jgi:hypothetical protein
MTLSRMWSRSGPNWMTAGADGPDDFAKSPAAHGGGVAADRLDGFSGGVHGEH